MAVRDGLSDEGRYIPLAQGQHARGIHQTEEERAAEEQLEQRMELQRSRAI